VDLSFGRVPSLVLGIAEGIEHGTWSMQNNREKHEKVLEFSVAGEKS
jgi:hypothetical protein